MLVLQFKCSHKNNKKYERWLTNLSPQDPTPVKLEPTLVEDRKRTNRILGYIELED